ncbi:hypothetical protein [Streptomyces himalayensis]|uniref:Uncharacterized protein n=1 Tax=Streptomyces himalayensis subsp. himalayensis TaxID=2756131 RepID=A0A7W0DHK8_9ACTN|nr:hypothetical protein [Streptomyces himalayensis]MBA2945241.1 hypothetical protein [Streptomyces himalayensis subsp. himalayensis]
MWPLDSRSRDHYFQGTVAQWRNENVAGLRPGDAGYRAFSVRPTPARESAGPVPGRTTMMPTEFEAAPTAG